MKTAIIPVPVRFKVNKAFIRQKDILYLLPIFKGNNLRSSNLDTTVPLHQSRRHHRPSAVELTDCTSQGGGCDNNITWLIVRKGLNCRYCLELFSLSVSLSVSPRVTFCKFYSCCGIKDFFWITLVYMKPRFNYIRLLLQFTFYILLQFCNFNNKKFYIKHPVLRIVYKRKYHWVIIDLLLFSACYSPLSYILS